MEVIVTRLLQDKMTPEEFEKVIFVTLSHSARPPLLISLAEQIICTSKVMKLMSVMLGRNSHKSASHQTYCMNGWYR